MFGVGDSVLCRSYLQPSKASNITSKLIPPYAGPFIIERFLAPSTVLLRTPGQRFSHRKAHLSQLKRYVTAIPP